MSGKGGEKEEGRLGRSKVRTFQLEKVDFFGKFIKRVGLGKWAMGMSKLPQLWLDKGRR